MRTNRFDGYVGHRFSGAEAAWDGLKGRPLPENEHDDPDEGADVGEHRGRGRGRPVRVEHEDALTRQDRNRVAVETNVAVAGSDDEENARRELGA